ncbi:MAG: DNA-binding response regulator [Deltaproteobacteria bacterium HGW-Deltaproteobacteria-6]|jgi:DNA-binding NarL/FixJ family response regulator|nr:MAG: DNA-binding response regulator [Deltaproteobacteria bacterium HGW-Deltaproteobacteria-6]
MDAEKKKIVIAEDHTILREGLKAMLSSIAGLEVIGEAEDGREAVRSASELKPDLMLMDLSMPRMNGIEAIKEIKKQHPEIKILILTVYKTEEYVLASLQAGADGYILKEASRAEFLLAIKNVLMGKHYLSPEISGKVIEGYLKGKQENVPVTVWDTLTSREREILKLVGEGYKNREIADDLCISMKTVEKHRENLMKKLDLHTASALTAYAIEKGLVAQ